MRAFYNYFVKSDIMKLVIKASKKYAKYLEKHLQEEHPKTRGRIKLKK